MTRYIRHETSHHNSSDANDDDSEYNEIHYLEYNDIDETIDMENRCIIYMKGYKCHKGDYCERLHWLPREDRVLCRFFKEGRCHREASHCWYFHPHKKVDKFKIEDDAPLLVPGVGHIMSYLRKKDTKPSDDFKK